MSKGANVALAALSEDAASVVVHLSWSSAAGEGDADVSVLPAGAGRQGPRRRDFYFYNHPASPDGSVQLLGKTPAGKRSEGPRQPRPRRGPARRGAHRHRRQPSTAAGAS
ncbi:TerD family protein [Streptomyces gougerotii]